MNEVTTMSLAALAAEYNKIAGILGEPLVQKFKDKPTGQKRLTLIREKQAAAAPAKRTKSARPKGEKKARSPHFLFQPYSADEVKMPREGSLRRKAFDLMDRPQGATQKELEKEVGWTERQAYEAIRLMHYSHKFGLRMSGENNERVHIVHPGEVAR